MLQKIKMALLSFSALFMLGAPIAVSGVAMAATDNQTGINSGLNCGSQINVGGENCNPSPKAATRLNATIAKAINIISVIVGAIAVVMIIIGGLRYVTSGGKQESVQGAKNTILYALIGLVIVALAQIIVHFVLAQTTTGTR